MHRRLGFSDSSRYTRNQIIGEGAYGKVYECKDNKTGKKVALKKYKFGQLTEGVPASTIKEISLLRKVHHPNIIKFFFLPKNRLYDVLIEGEELSIVLEYLPYDLKSYMEKFIKRFTEKERRTLLYHIIRGVEYLHSRTILHRDLKPCNILVTKKGLPKITDFGLGRRFTLPIGCYTHEIATLYYRPPEILLGTYEYSTPVDIWALGCIFAEIYNGRILFRGESEIGQLYAIFQVLGTPNEGCWNGVSQLKDYKHNFPQWKPKDLSKLCSSIDNEGIDLLKKMLTYDPLKRITAREALEHVFFKNVRSY
jgi:serine/threonine protein kinase